MDKQQLSRRNTLVGTTVLAVAGLMVGFAFASSPLFSIICAKLGLGGATQRAASASSEITDVPMTVRLDANIDKNLPWRFQPLEKSVGLTLGETKTIRYKATNTSDHATTGTATFNVTPDKIGQYFNKIECFCFQEQTLQPGESVEMGVTFFIDPALAKNTNTDEVRTITLSYTFFKSANGLPRNDSAASADTVKIPLAPVSGTASVN